MHDSHDPVWPGGTEGWNFPSALRPSVGQMSKRDVSGGFDMWFRVCYEDPMHEKKQAESAHAKNRNHVEPTSVGLLC